MKLSDRLFAQGVFAQGIGFPTVARDKARVRTIVTATHTRDDLQFALDVFAHGRPGARDYLRLAGQMRMKVQARIAARFRASRWLGMYSPLPLAGQTVLQAQNTRRPTASPPCCSASSGSSQRGDPADVRLSCSRRRRTATARADFADSSCRRGATRVVVQERDREPLAGTLPGNGYRLHASTCFMEFGDRARDRHLAARREASRRSGGHRLG